MALLDYFRRRQPDPVAQREPNVPTGAKPPTDTYTDIPVSQLGSWTVQKVRETLNAHQTGTFVLSSLLTEAMLGDDRIQSSLNGRVKGVTMRHLHTRPVKGPKGDKAAALVREWWPKIFSDELLDQMLTWAVFMGFALCEVQWETEPGADGELVWVPYLKVWHPEFVYYDLFKRQYVAITQTGNVWIDESDPKWFLFTPWGRYRGWMRGAVRSCSALWIIRQFARRDWARFCEIHGLPIKTIDAPAQSAAVDKQRMFQQVRNLGADTTILFPQQATPDGQKWGLNLVEAKDTSWQAFPGIIHDCDRGIQLVVRGTNLTSEVQGGSYAAAQVHSDEDSAYADSDCRKLCAEASRLLKWFVAYNLGDPSLTPGIRLEPPDDQDALALAQTQLQVMQAGAAAVGNGLKPDWATWCERFDIPLDSIGEPPSEGESDDPDLAPDEEQEESDVEVDWAEAAE